MRTALVLLVLGACGGSPPPKPVEPPPPPPPTRHVIEDSTVDDGGQEEGVTMMGQHGHMEVEDVEAGIAPHKQAMADCYMSNVNRRKWLGGQVVVHWDIKKDGTVTEVRLAETDPGTNLGNWAIEKCILEVAKAATFAKPKGGDADFTIPMEFKPTGRLVNWDEDQTVRAVGGQTSKIAKCAKGKVTPPKGPVWITVYVGAHGKVQSVGFAGKASIDEEWADCAVKAATGWRLPDPKGTIAKLSVQYPR
ncbi:MAG TPA: AgmX/PglI C-terminal domain-containing protein [Kofleriaceae bacterium]|jgi:TonB family protein